MLSGDDQNDDNTNQQYLLTPTIQDDTSSVSRRKKRNQKVIIRNQQPKNVSSSGTTTNENNGTPIPANSTNNIHLLSSSSSEHELVVDEESNVNNGSTDKPKANLNKFMKGLYEMSKNKDNATNNEDNNENTQSSSLLRKYQANITKDKLNKILKALDKHDRLQLLDESISIKDLYNNNQIDEKNIKILTHKKEDENFDIDQFEDITTFSTLQKKLKNVSLAHIFPLNEEEDLLLNKEENNEENNQLESSLKSQLQKQMEQENYLQKSKHIFRKITYPSIRKDLLEKPIMERIGQPTIVKINSKFIAVGTTNGLITIYHRKTENRLAILGSIQLESIVNKNGGTLQRPIQVTSLDFGTKMLMDSETSNEQDLLLLFYKLNEDAIKSNNNESGNNNTTAFVEPSYSEESHDLDLLRNTFRVLISGYSDGTIILWNLSNFKPIKILKGYFKTPILKINNFHKTSKQSNAIDFLVVDTLGNLKYFNVRKILFNTFYVDCQPINYQQIALNSLLNSSNSGSNGTTSPMNNTNSPVTNSSTVESSLDQEKQLLDNDRFLDFQVLVKSEGRHALDKFVITAITTETQVIVNIIKPFQKTLLQINESKLGNTVSLNLYQKKKFIPKIAWKSSQLLDGEHVGLNSLYEQSNPYLAIGWGNRLVFYHLEIPQHTGLLNMVGIGSTALPKMYYSNEIYVPFPIDRIDWLTDDLFLVMDSKQTKFLLIDRKLENTLQWIEEINVRDLALDIVTDPTNISIPDSLKKKYGNDLQSNALRSYMDVTKFEFIDVLRHSSIIPNHKLSSVNQLQGLDDDNLSLPSTTHSVQSELYRSMYNTKGNGILIKHKSPTIYLFGANELRAIRALSWDERIVALQTIGEYEEALNLAVEMFNDPSSIPAIIGLPSKSIYQRQEAVSQLIATILVDYRDTKLHQLDQEASHERKLELLVHVARTCLQRSIEINNIDLIEKTYESFENYDQEHVFTQLLVEELILNGNLSRMMKKEGIYSYGFISNQFKAIKALYTTESDGDKGLVDLTKYYKENLNKESSNNNSLIVVDHLPKYRISKLENIILNLDISKLDIPFEDYIDLYETYRGTFNCMYKMYIYIHAVLRQDYITPISEFLDEMSITNDLTSNENQSKLEAILQFLKNIITKNIIYTDAYQIQDTEQLQKIKRCLVDFIFEQSKKQITKDKELIILPNLQKLIKLNSKETFELLTLFFEDLDDTEHSTSPFTIVFPKPVKCPLINNNSNNNEFIIVPYREAIQDGVGPFRWVMKLDRLEMIDVLQRFILNTPFSILNNSITGQNANNQSPVISMSNDFDIDGEGPLFSFFEKKYFYQFLGNLLSKHLIRLDFKFIKRILTHICYDKIFTNDETKEILKQLRERLSSNNTNNNNDGNNNINTANAAYLEERREQLTKQYYFKRQGQQIIIKILEETFDNSNLEMTSYLLKFVDMAQENLCYDVGVYLGKKKKDYKNVIKNYINDFKLKQIIGLQEVDTRVFEYITDLTNDSEAILNNIHDAILEHLLDLMRVDNEEMTLMIVKHFPALHPQVLNTIMMSSTHHHNSNTPSTGKSHNASHAKDQDERLLFNYLSKIMTLEKIQNSKIEIDDELKYNYIKLLCKFEPNKVCDWLQTHHFASDYRTEDLLQDCRNIPDAISFLLERNGEVMEALNIVIKNIQREFTILEDTLGECAKTLDPENERFSQFKHVAKLRNQLLNDLNSSLKTESNKLKVTSDQNKLLEMEEILLGITNLDEIPLERYLECRKSVLERTGMISTSTANINPASSNNASEGSTPNEMSISSKVGVGASLEDSSPNVTTLSTNNLTFMMNHYYLSSSDLEYLPLYNNNLNIMNQLKTISIPVEELLESKKIRKELAVAISMCKRNTQRKTVDEKQVKQLWYKLLDQFNLPFAEYYKAYKFASNNNSTNTPHQQNGENDESSVSNSGGGSNQDSSLQEDIDNLQKKIIQAKELKKTKEDELNDKEEKLKQSQDEEEKKTIQKQIDKCKQYISLQSKRIKQYQKKIIELREKSKVEQQKSTKMYHLGKLWIQSILFKLTRVVVLSMIGNVAIPDIMKKLIKDNTKEEFARLKPIVFQLLDKFKYDVKLLQNANIIIEEDTFSLSKKYTERLSHGLCPTIPKCMLTDTLLSPEVDEVEDEKNTTTHSNNGSKKGGKKEKAFDVIRLFDTGYAYRLSALGNVTKCPTTTTNIKKKKYVGEKVKSITEEKKVSNELSRLKTIESLVKKKPAIKLYKTVQKESHLVRGALSGNNETKLNKNINTFNDLVFTGMERNLLPPTSTEKDHLVSQLFNTLNQQVFQTVETSVECAVIDVAKSQEQVIDSLFENAIQW
ncbi:hypothetical protein ABK040_013518 [Willaertia magna]